MNPLRSTGLALGLVGLLLLAAAAGAFTTAESQRSVEVYSDEEPGVFVGLQAVDRDDTACTVTLELSNNVPVPAATFDIDYVTAYGEGFDASVTSVTGTPVAVGGTAEIEVTADSALEGVGTVHVELEVSGDDLDVDLQETTWVRCVEPEDDGDTGTSEDGNEG